MNVTEQYLYYGNSLGTPSFNGGTGISIDMPDFDFGSSGGNSSSSSSASKGGFFSDFNLNGLLDTLLKGGMTWAQIEAAKNGKDVYVQGNGGSSENITPILISKFEETAKAQQTTVNNLMMMMQQQMQQNQNNQPPKKDNTLMYVGIGAGVLVLLGGVFLMTKSKK